MTDLNQKICTTLLVTCLLQYEDSTAAVVDTTGNFDVLKLYTLIVARLSRQPHVLASLRASVGLELGSAEDVAAKVLDRVKIMRVFDFEGVREAVGEIRDELEGRRRRQSAERREDEAKKEETPITDRENLAKNREKPKRTFVADSEDEDDDEEEEMLFESENKPSPVSNVQDLDTTSVPEQAQPKLSGTSRQDSETISNKSTPKTLKFILIDNLTQVLSPLLKNDIIKGSSFVPFLPSFHLYNILSNITSKTPIKKGLEEIKKLTSLSPHRPFPLLHPPLLPIPPNYLPRSPHPPPNANNYPARRPLISHTHNITRRPRTSPARPQPSHWHTASPTGPRKRCTTPFSFHLLKQQSSPLVRRVKRASGTICACARVG
jgi:hypothetical protein